jgi:hypothetical protein
MEITSWERGWGADREADEHEQRVLPARVERPEEANERELQQAQGHHKQLLRARKVVTDLWPTGSKRCTVGIIRTRHELSALFTTMNYIEMIWSSTSVGCTAETAVNCSMVTEWGPRLPLPVESGVLRKGFR